MQNRTIDAELMRRLRVFVSIVESGSMTAAATALGLSRSVVSGHLKRLESDLGVRLLERTTRSMAITQVGEQVYERARVMIDAGQQALDLVDAHLGTVRGVLRVAMPIELATAMLSPVVQKLRARHPELRIHALVGDHNVDLVRDGIDVAIRVGVPEDSSLMMRRLCRTQEIFVASPGFVEMHELQGLDAVTRAPWVTHALLEPTAVATHPDGRTTPLSIPPPVVRVGSSTVLHSMIRDGVGMGMMPEVLVHQDLASGALVRVCAPWLHRRVDVYALMPSRVTSPATQAFLEAIHAEMNDG